MQPPSEADIVAATTSLGVRRDLKLAQIAALQVIQECLAEAPLAHPESSLANAISAYLGHLVAEHQLDAEVLDAQVAHNKHVLDAYHSNILLPRVHPRRTVG
jgi:hypothetical protein